MIRLATEFQGYARELHDLSAETFADWASPGNQPLRVTLRTRLTEGRRLDSGNANPGSLGSDFDRLGFSLWSDIKATDPGAVDEQEQLENLNRQWRWWFPRGIDLAGIEPAYADHVASIINGQRRRSLDYQSPTKLYAALTVR